MRKIVVFGGTGFIGRALLAELAKTASSKESASDRVGEVVVVSRTDAFAPRLAQLFEAGPKARLVTCDLIEGGPTSKLVAALHGADAIFYALQFPGQPVQNHAKGYTYARYDSGGVSILLDGPLAGHSARFVYLSGAGAGQGRPQDWFRAKDTAEAKLARWSESAGGSFLALRPSLVYGAEDVSLNRLLGVARASRVCPLFGKGDTPLFPIWVKDLARSLVSLGLDASPQALNGAFNLPGPERISFRDLLAMLFVASGVKAAFLPVPIGFARFGAGILSLLPSPPLTPEAIEFLTTGPDMPLTDEPTARAALEAVRASFSSAGKAFETYVRST